MLYENIKICFQQKLLVFSISLSLVSPTLPDDFPLSTSYFSSYRPASVYLWCVHSRAVVFQPCTEAKETLGYVTIELHLYAKTLL